MSHENKRNHSCPTCGKKFLTMWHLKKHSVTHKEAKDIICPTCSKGFKNNESLQEHMTIHTGEMPFECHICGRKVRILTNLYKHFIVHKKNKTYYSKKDGLPDPLDTYIVEQQKKKFSNTILQTAIEKRKETSTLEITLEPEQEEEVVEADPLEPDTVLTVNRSKRVTYRAPPKTSLAGKTGTTSSAAVPSTSIQQESFIVTEIDGNYSLRLADGTSSELVYSVIEADKSNVAN
jgi:DNA-directed RNA polymerase subunit RPC12/RpoP